MLQEKALLDWILEENWFQTLWDLIQSELFNKLDRYNLERDTQKRKFLLFWCIREFSYIKTLSWNFDKINKEIDYYLKYCMEIQNLDKLLWFYFLTTLLLDFILNQNLWYLLYNSNYELKKYLKFMINDIDNESFRKENTWNFEKIKNYMEKILNNFANDVSTLTFTDL